MKSLIYKMLNGAAQVTIWAGFELLRLSARVYGRDLQVNYRPSKVGAVITITRRQKS